MCFSAAASFSTSGVLLVVGVAAISRVSRPSQLLLAATPIVFAIQQLSEGALWLSFERPDFITYQQILIYVFVFFGQIVWPIWVPMANLLLEKKGWRRKTLILMVWVGVLISSYLMYQTVAKGVTARVMENHIHYMFDYADSLAGRFSSIYLIPTVISHFISSNKKINLLGLLTLISFIISKIFYVYFVFSVWCFFAAVLSIGIFFIIKSMNMNAGIIGSSIRLSK